METSQFVEMIQKSLDKDISDLLYNKRVSARDAMVLQMLRLARGRALPITDTQVEGWSADGVTWLPKQPGT